VEADVEILATIRRTTYCTTRSGRVIATHGHQIQLRRAHFVAVTHHSDLRHALASVTSLTVDLAYFGSLSQLRGGRSSRYHFAIHRFFQSALSFVMEITLGDLVWEKCRLRSLDGAKCEVFWFSRMVFTSEIEEPLAYARRRFTFWPSNSLMTL